MRSHSYTVLGIPLAIVYLVAFLLPAASFFAYSLHEPLGPASVGDEVTLLNYKDILTDSYYLNAIRLSFSVSLGVAILGLPLAYPIAFFIVRSQSRTGFVVLLVVVGMLFSNAVIRSLGWRVLLSSTGPVNQLLLAMGFISEPVALLDCYVYVSVMIGLIHALLPIYVVTLIPICKAVPKNLVRASAGLGASAWQTFWRVILPLTRRGVVASMFLIFATSIGTFTTPVMLGGGRILLLPVLIREKVLVQLNWAVGATLSVMLAILVLTISLCVAGRTGAEQKTVMA